MLLAEGYKAYLKKHHLRVQKNIVTTPTTTKPQHSSWVGHENDFAHHHHHHPTPTTIETKHQPLGAPDEHLLTPT